MYILSVTIVTKFNELFDAVHHETDNLKISAAEAVLNGDFSQVTAIEETYRKLQKLEADVKLASNSFESKNKSIKPISSASTLKRTRKPNGRLKVIISNDIIEEQTIANTFVNTLKVLGFSRIEKLNIIVSGAPLLSKSPSNDYHTQQRVDGWYITTHVNMKNSQRILKDISKELNIPIKIEIT